MKSRMGQTKWSVTDTGPEDLAEAGLASQEAQDVSGGCGSASVWSQD